MQIFLLELSAVVVDGRHWLHEARCWLSHESLSDCNLDFPAPVRAVSAAIDGAPATPLRAGPSRLWLPLPGRAGVRRVCLRWTYEEAEPLNHPNLTPPTIAGAETGPMVWTLHVPPGWEAAPRPGSRDSLAGAAREAVLALYRAEVQLRICRQLSAADGANADAGALADAQRRFADYYRHARHALNKSGDHGVTGPDGQPLGEWLMKLQADRLDRAATGRQRAAQPRADACGSVGFADLLPARGTPISWQSQQGREPPMPQLVPQARQQVRHALAVSAQWLGLLIAIWLLSLLPWPLARWRQFWPEHLALLGVLGWWLMDWTEIALFLLVLAVFGRIFLLGSALRSLLRKRARPAEPSATPHPG